MRALVLAGVTGLLSMTLTTPALASGVPEQWSTGPFTAQVAVRAGDVNGDGKDDVVSFTTDLSGCTVFLSTGSGFQPGQDWGACRSGANDSPYYAYFIGDADNDGRADAITVRPNAISTPRVRGIFVARSITDGGGVARFGTPTQWLDNTIAGDQGSRAVDLEGDGDTDVIGLFSGGVPPLAARSDGTATLPLIAWGPQDLRGETQTLAADATGDGKADYLLIDSAGTRVVPGTANRWFDTPPAQWSTTPFHGTRKTLTADIDADGKADLVAVNDTEVQVMRSTGTGYSAPELWYPGSFSGTKDTLTADVDGDGDADLVAVNDNDVWVLRSQ
ncbi:VCBS repeat-containing protein [Amycolatopsis sp. FDAARGOS 1241]|uniref:FG-GAP repeat domain-containing protein n=1 Tax=Amycolatopsis sp. FDAARGOS 1241 TaxID=2778070 RepID=UPI001951B2A5|nr:VCBS repeat-containing protein [Amycolatopsis sp. FDAARGOS 1241]QRP50310.1 VCBS repeat-containing protein [Amycolatopsis sp. FDAARGOS 1241]